MKEVAKSVKANNPEIHLIILLIDERPEEVTDIKEAIETLYDVKVVSVNTQNFSGKKRRTRKGVGVTRSWKKAMVKLDDEHRLDLY